MTTEAVEFDGDERDRAADERDLAASQRDELAEARERLLAAKGVSQRSVTHLALAAAKNAVNVLQEQEEALRAAAAVVAEETEVARLAAMALTVEADLAARDRLAAAADRAAAAADREDAALDRIDSHEALVHAYRDDLTQTLMRDAGRDQLGNAVVRAHRGEPLVIAFIDVDGLKRVNDEHGHGAGDRLLQQVGTSLTEGLRAYDLVVRYGGDEFVCALPGATLSEAERRFAGVSEALAKALTGATISIGLAQLRPVETLDDVIDRADRAMYEQRTLRQVSGS